jgi:hypothetical protein
MTEPALPTSPRIEELRRMVESGDVDVLAQFWRYIEQVGTPLIEPAVAGLCLLNAGDARSTCTGVECEPIPGPRRQC